MAIQRLRSLFTWTCLSTLWRSTWFWLAMAALAFALEAGALFYQHVLHVYPCELCIYVRVWTAGIFFASLLALCVKRFPIGAALFSGLNLYLAIGLAGVTYHLLGIEYDFGEGGACSFFANFPSWAPLDQWLPFMFQVQDMCQATPRIIFSISMADCLAAVCVFYFITFGTSLIGSVSHLLGRKG